MKNKELFHQLRVLFATSVCCVAFGCAQNGTLSNDVKVAETVLLEIKSDELRFSNDNSKVISLISRLDNGGDGELSELKQECDIPDDSIFAQLLRRENYSYFLSQHVSSGNWNPKEFKDVKLINDTKHATLISKPVFTNDKKLALVFVSNAKRQYFYVLKRENEKWVGHKIFCLSIS